MFGWFKRERPEPERAPRERVCYPPKFAPELVEEMMRPITFKGYWRGKERVFHATRTGNEHSYRQYLDETDGTVYRHDPDAPFRTGPWWEIGQLFNKAFDEGRLIDDAKVL